MRPLSEDELKSAAEELWHKNTRFADNNHDAFVWAYIRGYAKCVDQMADEFNELLRACYTAIKNQTGVVPQELLNQLKGGNK